MPKIDLTYEQLFEAANQLAAHEKDQLVAALKARSDHSDDPPFTEDDPLWNVVGMGQGTGESVARHHDDILYRKHS
ncbi:hypothetical protein [Candidatus Entotheonella palauensis]|uniref:Uncharacterized protein n=1 Tax=Candidatus Entotheonella gemina TaxID=1429439 RepID=W4M255_9BACT|nr:hypothetical protein [Candidatus Entotheonella palauensis]ETX04233.1 MAG: hypothetical protein ETSY2_29950 [Candidatus Entotheonella gemina]